MNNAVLKNFRVDKDLLDEWKLRYGKNGDQHLRNLMINDLKGDS